MRARLYYFNSNKLTIFAALLTGGLGAAINKISPVVFEFTSTGTTDQPLPGITNYIN
jgi:hypothetical protein